MTRHLYPDLSPSELRDDSRRSYDVAIAAMRARFLAQIVSVQRGNDVQEIQFQESAAGLIARTDTEPALPRALSPGRAGIAPGAALSSHRSS